MLKDIKVALYPLAVELFIELLEKVVFPPRNVLYDPVDIVLPLFHPIDVLFFPLVLLLADLLVHLLLLSFPNLILLVNY